MKWVKLLLFAAIAIVALVVSSCDKVSAWSSPTVSIEVGSGAFWAFVTALSAVASIVAQGLKKLFVSLAGLVASALASAVVVGAVALIGWVQLIPPGIGSWLGLWFMTYLSACGLFDSATLKGLLPTSAAGREGKPDA